MIEVKKRKLIQLCQFTEPKHKEHKGTEQYV